MAETNYEAKILDGSTFKIFKGLYNDFKTKAVSDYKFELAPLEYEDFINAVEKRFLNCIVLTESSIPVAFLVYTTSISESVELNIIHCIGNEDKTTKQSLLVEKFLELTETERQTKVVAYPMLGGQSSFTTAIAKYGFKFIGLKVLRFLFTDPSYEKALISVRPTHKPEEYSIVPYSDTYRKDVVKIIHSSFKDSSDSIYDSRYKTTEGTQDIINKIVENIYGDFLSEATSVLLHRGVPCGICFANVTGNTIANIPLVAINKNHRGKGFSELMLSRTLTTIINWVKEGKCHFSEINVTTETNNFKAVKMYTKVGFREDYYYPQAYLQSKHKKQFL